MRRIAHRALTAVAASAVLATLASSGASAAANKLRDANHSGNEASTLASPELWATVDVCKAGDEPVVGIRGSMPSDGHAHDTMYMRFGVEYLESSTGKWVYLPKGVETSYTQVGNADATRQAGRNFHLASPTADQSFELRGVVEFQWRRAGKVVLSASRDTTTGHHTTVLHAEPSGFSAATCKIE